MLPCAAGLWAVGNAAGADGAEEQQPASSVIVRPADNAKALVNPEMGWTMHFCQRLLDFQRPRANLPAQARAS